ncbi:group I intron-associated PD-(D/E)XK endonuclease [Mesorhizobium sp. ANAO-SY3R2]|uniref:group I intron-associated PD-(D/E)XK endonuclease n=1 Tax=Mesorhizobium sp. ANAO-SY3R2 TaxID=3166644 RepID=UPI0036729060
MSKPANTKTIGERTEAIVLAHLLRAGAVVLMPFGDNQRYDLVIDRQDGTFERVQCKTGQLKNGCVMFWACSTNGFTHSKKGYAGQADVFMVYCPDTDKIYRVPVSEVGETNVNLRVEPAKVNLPSIRWARDYEM